LLPAAGESGEPVQLRPNDVSFPSFSPDGRWLAFTEVGADGDVFVINVEHPAVRHRVSISGGEEGLWSPLGDRIIYRMRQKWFEVDVSTRPDFRSGRPRLLFEAPYLNVAGWSHDISPDGRQLFLLGSRQETTTRLVAVQNWFSELQRLGSLGKKTTPP
jgi:Tol biopolymer transport system component